MQQQDRRLIVPLLGLVGLILACSGVCNQQDAESTDPSQANQPAAQKQPATPKPSKKQTGPMPTKATIQRAQQLGIPPVPMNSAAIGPFDGPEQSLAYYDKDGRVTFYRPDQFAIYFGTTNPKRFEYVVTPVATFKLDAKNKATKLKQLPAQTLSQWPHANALATVLIKESKKKLDAMRKQAKSASSKAHHYRVLSNISRGMHNTNMNILNNIGSSGCTKHYDGVYYLGCW